MRKKWHYRGDVNIEHGGTFYCIDSLEISDEAMEKVKNG